MTSDPLSFTVGGRIPDSGFWPPLAGRWAFFARRLWAAMLAALFIGCAALTTSYDGTLAKPDNRISLTALDGAPATWQRRDVALHFTASAHDGTLRISGTVDRLNTIKHFSNAQFFRVSLHFIADDGTIIGGERLWSAGISGDVKLIRWAFSRQFPIPAGASAIGFSYRGAFSERGGDDGARADWEVWERP